MGLALIGLVACSGLSFQDLLNNGRFESVRFHVVEYGELHMDHSTPRIATSCVSVSKAQRRAGPFHGSHEKLKQSSLSQVATQKPPCASGLGQPQQVSIGRENAMDSLKVAEIGGVTAPSWQRVG